MRLMILSVSGRLGGAERVLVDVVAVTRQRHPDWPIAILSVEDGPLRQAVEALGAEFDVVTLPKVLAETGEFGRGRLLTLVRLVAAAPGLFGYTRTLGRNIERWRPDVLLANGLKAQIVSSWVRGKARLVWHVHDYLTTRPVSAALFRRFAGRASVIVVNSKSVAADIRTVLGEAGRVEVLYNAVDDTRFSPEGPTIDLDQAAGLPPAPAGTIRVGLVATYARWKGHEVFLQAMARLDASRPVRGYVVGGPVYQIGASQWSRQELAARVTALGLDGRVGLVGFQQDTAPVYRALDVAVHASTAPEPFGLVIAEAMMCGRAVVVSAAGGAIEVAGDDGALSHAPGDVAGLALRLEQLVSSPELRHQLGARAHAAATDRFSRERFARGLDDVLA